MSRIRLRYFGYHPYNNPTHSERNIELPLAFWFLDLFKTDIRNVIEVGEVTSFYRPPQHAVYDIAAEKSETIRRDAAEIDYAGKHLLSISTIEHIGTSDYGQTPDPKRLPLVLEKMLLSKNYLITFALGYNPQLEDLIKDMPYLILKRVAPTQWQQTDNKNLTGYQYHKPWYAGNGVCVLTNMLDLQLEFAPRSLMEVLSRRAAPQWSWKRFLRALRQEMKDDRQRARRETTSA